ncbi:MAG: Ig-like domain-containing protein [Myxococcales bacterium]
MSTVRSGNGIYYAGGHVMTGTINIYYIWYGNWSSSNPQAVPILEDLARKIGGSALWNINTLYDDRFGGHVSSQVRFMGSTADQYSQGPNITSVWDVVNNALTLGRLPRDSNGIYFVLSSADVSESGLCTEYCGYHNYERMTHLRYAFVGAGDHCSSVCSYVPSSPNHNPSADFMAAVITHELAETATDPESDAWTGEGPAADENADKCISTFGQTYNTQDGTAQANLRLGDRDFLLHQLWVNARGGYCALFNDDQIISVGPTHTLAIQTNGSLWAWGKNDRGQLGDETTTDRRTPVMIAAGPPGFRWVSVAAGNKFSLGLTSDGWLWGWGDQTSAQIGNGISSTPQLTPIALEQAGNWQSVRAGDQYGMATTLSGELFAWGYNGSGQLGVGDDIIHPYPTREVSGLGTSGTPPWAHFDAGTQHVLGFAMDQTAYPWGANTWGALGLGDTINRYWPQWLGYVPSSQASHWYRFSAGTDFSLALVDIGKIWSWGRNNYGQIAAPSSTPFSDHPIQVISSTRPWESISAGKRHGMAVRQDGTLWTWGSNSNGQLGTSAAVGSSFAPVTQESTRATNWVSAFGRQDTSIGVKADGAVWVWGNNTSGQLGLGDTTSRSAPTAMNWTISRPVVDVTSPKTLTSFPLGSTIQIVANGSGGRITKVEFYRGTQYLGTDTTSPYTYAWSTGNVSAGKYTIKARAFNALGQSTWSPEITVGLFTLSIATTDITTTTTVDFTKEGSLDWLHRGQTSPSSVEQKNTASPQISGFNYTGGGGSEFVQDTATPLTVSWNDGTNGIASTKTGIKPLHPPGYYNLFAEASSTATRVLSLYFKLVNGSVAFSAEMEEQTKTQAPWSNTSTTPKYRVYRVTYHGGLAYPVSILATLSLPTGSNGNLTFLGTTLH